MSQTAKKVFNSDDVQVLVSRDILRKSDFLRINPGVLLSLQNEGVYYLMLTCKIGLCDLQNVDYSEHFIKSLECPRVTQLLKSEVIKFIDLAKISALQLEVIAIPEIYELLATKKLKFSDLTLNFCQALLVPFVQTKLWFFSIDELKDISADAILAMENTDIVLLLETEVLSKQQLLNICSNCRRALENVCIRELFRSKAISYEDLYQVNDYILNFVDSDLVSAIKRGSVPKSFLFDIERRRTVFGNM